MKTLITLLIGSSLGYMISISAATLPHTAEVVSDPSPVNRCFLATQNGMITKFSEEYKLGYLILTRMPDLKVRKDYMNKTMYKLYLPKVQEIDCQPFNFNIS